MKCTYALLAILLCLPFSSAYAEDVHGIMMVVKGTIKIQSGKDNKTVQAKVGAKVFPQDTIIAEKDSRAKIVMSDKNEINISPETQLSLEKYIYNPQTNQKNVLLNVVYGKVRSTVNQKYDGDQNTFHVKTPSAVAGVRGTDFLASYDAGSKLSKVVTFSGVVEVGKPGAGGAIANPVRVAPGQFTTASVSGSPAAPSAVPKAELESMNRESKAETAKGDSEGKGSDSKKDSKKDDGKKSGGTSGGGSSSNGGNSNNGNSASGNSNSANGNGTTAAATPAGSAGGAAPAAGGDNGGANNSAPAGSSANTGAPAATNANASTSGGDTSGGSSGDSRAPASTPAPAVSTPIAAAPSTDSMISHSDLGPAAVGGGAATPDFSSHGGDIPTVPQVPKAADTLPPVCTFCNAAISNGPTHLNIQVNFK